MRSSAQSRRHCGIQLLFPFGAFRNHKGIHHSVCRAYNDLRFVCFCGNHGVEREVDALRGQIEFMCVKLQALLGQKQPTAVSLQRSGAVAPNRFLAGDLFPLFGKFSLEDQTDQKHRTRKENAAENTAEQSKRNAIGKPKKDPHRYAVAYT